jgi:biotin carboxyl carrier protein
MAQEIVEIPLPGKVLKVEAMVGDKINEGDTLIILESMKMENPIVSTVSGIVKSIDVKIDQVVKTGQPIAVIEY